VPPMRASAGFFQTPNRTAPRWWIVHVSAISISFFSLVVCLSLFGSPFFGQRVCAGFPVRLPVPFSPLDALSGIISYLPSGKLFLLCNAAASFPQRLVEGGGGLGSVADDSDPSLMFFFRFHFRPLGQSRATVWPGLLTDNHGFLPFRDFLSTGPPLSGSHWRSRVGIPKSTSDLPPASFPPFQVFLEKRGTALPHDAPLLLAPRSLSAYNAPAGAHREDLFFPWYFDWGVVVRNSSSGPRF